MCISYSSSFAWKNSEVNLIKWRDHVSNVSDHESFTRLKVQDNSGTHSRVGASKYHKLKHISEIEN